MFDIYMEQYKNDMLRDLVQFLKIESVKSEPEPNEPYGKGVFNALMHILNIAGKMDFECVNLFGHMAYIDYGAGDETLAILTHIDVVPAGEGWTKKPFGGEIENGRVYGRGAMDNKGPAIAALYALKALSDNMVILNKKVRLIFGCDEESGWSDIDFYKQHEPLPDIAFSPDGDYPIINAEKGLMHFRLTAKTPETQNPGVRLVKFQSGVRANVVPNKAECTLQGDFNQIKAVLDVYKDEKGATFDITDTPEGILITAHGVSAHGARPDEGVNAAAALLLFVSSLDLAEGGIHDYIRFAAKKVSHTIHGEHVGLNISDEVSGPLTMSLGIVEADTKQISLVFDIRYPINYNEEFVAKKISENFGDKFNFEILHKLDPHFIDENTDLVVKLKQAYEEITGEKAYVLSIGGATYARAFKNAVTFGPKFPGKPNLEHGPDEYIEIDELILNAKIIANALIKICGGTVE